MKLEMTLDDMKVLSLDDIRMMQIFVRYLRLKYRCKWKEYGRYVDGQGVRILELHIGDKRKG